MPWSLSRSARDRPPGQGAWNAAGAETHGPDAEAVETGQTALRRDLGLKTMVSRPMSILQKCHKLHTLSKHHNVSAVAMQGARDGRRLDYCDSIWWACQLSNTARAVDCLIICSCPRGTYAPRASGWLVSDESPTWWRHGRLVWFHESWIRTCWDSDELADERIVWNCTATRPMVENYASAC